MRVSHEWTLPEGTRSTTAWTDISILEVCGSRMTRWDEVSGAASVVLPHLGCPG